jgi:hypothetical protein
MINEIVSALQKLWWKGIDISASVIANTITAIIVAIIAEITWNRKRKKDLQLERDKELQRRQMADDLRRETLAGELRGKRWELARYISEAKDREDLQERYQEARSWLYKTAISLEAYRSFSNIDEPPEWKEISEVTAFEDKVFNISNAKKIAEALMAVEITAKNVR